MPPAVLVVVHFTTSVGIAAGDLEPGSASAEGDD
jgi:hypothetical protein